MKKTILCLPAIIFLFAQCKKKEKPVPTHYCTVQEQRGHPKDDSARLLVPNAFSPNGDGLNDYFAPITQHIATIDFTVYDSSDNIVFHTNQLAQGWHAPKPEKIARYFYQVTASTQGGDQMSWCGWTYAMSCRPSNLSPDTLIFADQFDPNAPEGYYHGTTSETYIFMPCD